MPTAAPSPPGNQLSDAAAIGSTPSAALVVASERLGQRLAARGLYLVTAESCTGGGIAAAVTDIAGSSGWFDRGYVTYSNAAKVELLGVAEPTLATHGAVSEPVVAQMLAGALARGGGQVAVAVSGIAGPGGGSTEKPVGTVCFGFAVPGQRLTETCWFPGDRGAVRAASVAHALQRLLDLLDEEAGDD